MSRIPLRLCTVEDAKWHYKHKQPIKFNSLQTYGGKDDTGNRPSIKKGEKLTREFILDGRLKWEHGKKSGIIENWLGQDINGPYHSIGKKDIFYYLGGTHSEMGCFWMQICSGPLNILSEDCADECNIWIL